MCEAQEFNLSVESGNFTNTPPAESREKADGSMSAEWLALPPLNDGSATYSTGELEKLDLAANSRLANLFQREAAPDHQCRALHLHELFLLEF